MKSVLIIDDELDFGVLMQKYFSARNFEVLIAHTLEEGMEILEKFKPEVVLLDNNLPDGLGWGKLQYILQAHPTVKLHLISALDVPKTSASTFRILEKLNILDELKKMFD
jgi:DNA-binding response OmpR family regulator